MFGSGSAYVHTHLLLNLNGIDYSVLRSSIHKASLSRRTKVFPSWETKSGSNLTYRRPICLDEQYAATFLPLRQSCHLTYRTDSSQNLTCYRKYSGRATLYSRFAPDFFKTRDMTCWSESQDNDPSLVSEVVQGSRVHKHG